MKYNHQIINAILRQDLPSFVAKCFNTINPAIPYERNWHIELICKYLNAVENGEINRLIINIPPRNLKSICVNVAWTAWILGHYPSKKIITTSYSDNISIKHSLDTRFIIETEWYKKLFPHTKLSKKENRKKKFLTTQYGMRFASSTGGSITGEGGDILIVDDPHNPVQIHSRTMRNKIHNWYEQTFVTRLNDPQNGAIIIVMQRLHDEDLCGYLTNKDANKWHILKIPVFTATNINYPFNYIMKENTTIHNTRYNKSYLDKLQEEIGNNNFIAQYMQDPIKESLSLLLKTDISYYDELPLEINYYLLSWDTAIKINNYSDYSVCTIWAAQNNTLYLVDFLRKKLTYPLLKEEAIRLIHKYKPEYICIEDKASGQSLIQDLRSESYQNIIPIKPKLDKITRFASTIPLFQSGKVLLPKKAKFNMTIINEITLFPHSKHDDIVDSISQAINFIKTLKIKTENKNIRISEL